MSSACSCTHGLARKLLMLTVLCAILCLCVDIANAARDNNGKSRKRSKKKRKSVKKRRKSKLDPLQHPYEMFDEVTLPNESVRSSFKSTQVVSSYKDKKPSKPKHPPKPHIIFVVADDLGYNDVGYHTKGTGCVARTPTIDNLALSGVRLENYYVQPICTPTRASLMTGRYPIRMGLQHGNIDPTDPTCMPTDETTLPEKLRELGYATHAIGKWHLGFSRPACMPTRRGFDSFLGILLGSTGHYSHNKNGVNALYSNESAEWNYEGVHSSDVYTERAVETIRRHDKSVPLFMYLSYQAVHSPISAPEKFQTGYKERYPRLWAAINGTDRLEYLSLMESIDVGLKTVTEALATAGLWQNTILIFTSDNGGKTSFSASNWPLRGEKNTLWEGGIKGVAFVNSPLLPNNMIGTVQNGLMHVSDWYPTLIEGVAGGNAEGDLPLDGKNMWSTITKGSPSPRYEILHNIDQLDRMKSRKEGKTFDTPPVHNRWGNAKWLPFDPRILAGVRYDNWKLITGYQNIKYAGWVPPPESFKKPIKMQTFDDSGIFIRLYDISKDPEEKINLATSNVHIVHKLLKRLKYHSKNLVFRDNHFKDPAAVPPAGLPGTRRAWKPWLP